MAKSAIRTKVQLRQVVERCVRAIPASDVHTHLYPEAFGELMLWGIDALLTKDDLMREMLRFRPELSYEQMMLLSKKEQADYVWTTLFVERIPASAACRGILSILHRLGLDTSSKELAVYRSFFEQVHLADYIDRIFELTHVTTVCMTSNPFVEAERKAWEHIDQLDPRFNTTLCLDVLLNSWPSAILQLKDWGYDVEISLNEKTCREIRSFLKYWIARMNPLYMAVLLPSPFSYQEEAPCGRIIDQCVLPVAREANIPLALMFGAESEPSDASAGEAWAVEALCSAYPDNLFLCTLTFQKNQMIRLGAAVRQYPNLQVIGGRLPHSSLNQAKEMVTAMLELLGAGMIPYHSDCRVLEQLLLHWDQVRTLLGKVLYDKYSDLMSTGWRLTEDEIAREVAGLFGESFWRFLGRSNPATAFR